MVLVFSTECQSTYEYIKCTRTDELLTRNTINCPEDGAIVLKLKSYFKVTKYSEFAIDSNGKRNRDNALTGCSQSNAMSRYFFYNFFYFNTIAANILPNINSLSIQIIDQPRK